MAKSSDISMLLGMATIMPVVSTPKAAITAMTMASVRPPPSEVVNCMDSMLSSPARMRVVSR